MSALFKLTYGLYLLTAKENGFNNGCIINTVMQVAENPDRLVIAINKQNKTHSMVKNTNKFCISTITTEADFSLFERFGMQSGNSVDKFKDFGTVTATKSGILRLTKFSNAFITATVYDSVDFGTHTLFLATVDEMEVLNDNPPCTYDYYHAEVKPKPKTDGGKKWVCNICGYVYNGENLPDDYICPLCKHGKEDFTLI